jgi:ABC-2 type transport system permease protein
MNTHDAFYQLARANVLETVRDRMTLIFTTIFPLAFIGLFVMINSMSPSSTVVGLVSAGTEFPRPAIVGALGSGYVFDDLSDADARARLAAGQFEAIVAQDDTGTVVVTGTTDTVDVVTEIVGLLRSADLPDIETADPIIGSPPFDAVRFGIPGVLVMSLTSLALLGLASALVAQRARGTLKLFGLTPVRRLTFLLAQVPGRVLIAGIQTLVMLSIAGITGFLDAGGIAKTFLVVAIGLSMLLALGYLLGGLIPSPELAQGMLSGFIPIALMFSGVLLPLFILPDALGTAARFSPFFYLGDALRQVIGGDLGENPLSTNLLVMTAVAVAATAVAMRTFRWDVRRKGT